MSFSLVGSEWLVIFAWHEIHIWMRNFWWNEIPFLVCPFWWWHVVCLWIRVLWHPLRVCQKRAYVIYKGLLCNDLVKRKWFTMSLCYVSNISAQSVMSITIIRIFAFFQASRDNLNFNFINTAWVNVTISVSCDVCQYQ